MEEFKKIFNGLYRQDVLPLNVSLIINKALEENNGEYSIKKIDDILTEYLRTNPTNIRADYLLSQLPGRFQPTFFMGVIYLS